MSPYERESAYRAPLGRSPWRRRFSAALPWVFVLGVAAGTMLPVRHWVHWPVPQATDRRAEDAEVIRTIDGDTFEARVHVLPGRDLFTRVRLRGIDAPELKAACAQELKLAEAATDALRDLLGQGGVTIYHIGPDKYQGRVVADVATKRTDNVSAALLAAGHMRSYNGGHRNGWCESSWRWWK